MSSRGIPGDCPGLSTENLKQSQDLGFSGAEYSARKKTERNAKLHGNNGQTRAKPVHSVRGVFARITDPPPLNRNAAPGGTGAADHEKGATTKSTQPNDTRIGSTSQGGAP
jgi:hypothetical protein